MWPSTMRETSSPPSASSRDQLARDLLPGDRRAREVGVRVLLGRNLALAPDRGARSDRLEAAVVGAVALAAGPVLVDHHVTQLRAGARVPAVELAVEHEAAADAGADRQADDVVRLRARRRSGCSTSVVTFASLSMNTGSPSRSDIMSRNGMSAIGRLTAITATPVALVDQAGDAEADRLDVGIGAPAARRRASTIASIELACSARPSTSRCTRSCTSSCSSTTPPSSLVPPRSMPITLRLIRGGVAATEAIYGLVRVGRDRPPPPEIPREKGDPPSFRYALRQARIPRLPLPSRVPEPPVSQAGRATASIATSRGTASASW